MKKFLTNIQDCVILNFVKGCDEEDAIRKSTENRWLGENRSRRDRDLWLLSRTFEIKHFMVGCPVTAASMHIDLSESESGDVIIAI